MQRLHWIGATALCAVVATFFVADAGDHPDRTHDRATAAATPAVATPIAEPAVTPPVTLPAAGHYVLVIEGDRTGLAITHASHKEADWGGVPKGLRSDWRLSIRDGKGTELQQVPLDLSAFDLRPERQGKGVQVQGCMVKDARVGLLASVPCVEGATTYVLLHGDVVVGSSTALRVHDLAGGGR